MYKLYSFYWDCGRQGNLEGLFIADSDVVEESIGKEVYFGEVLGKHSEVYGEIEECDLTVISEDQEKVEWLESILGTSVSGFNPLTYIMEEDEE